MHAAGSGSGVVGRDVGGSDGGRNDWEAGVRVWEGAGDDSEVRDAESVGKDGKETIRRVVLAIPATRARPEACAEAASRIRGAVIDRVKARGLLALA